MAFHETLHAETDFRHNSPGVRRLRGGHERDRKHTTRPWLE
jgi:hypothetical protein